MHVMMGRYSRVPMPSLCSGPLRHFVLAVRRSEQSTKSHPHPHREWEWMRTSHHKSRAISVRTVTECASAVKYPQFQKAIVNYSPQFQKTIANYPQFQKTIINYPQFQKTIVNCPQFQKTIVNYSQFQKTIVNYSQFQNQLSTVLYSRNKPVYYGIPCIHNG